LVKVRAAGAITGAVTLNANALGAIAVTKFGGGALAAGNVTGAGHELLLVYRASVPRWELINPNGGMASTTSIADAGSYFTGDDAEEALQELGAAVFSGSGFEFVGSVTVTGSAATSMSLSPLDLDADGMYFVEIVLQNATGSLTNIRTFFNADATTTNYDTQLGLFAGTSVGAARANSGDSNQMAATTGDLTVWGFIQKGLDGNPTVSLYGRENVTTAIQLRNSVVRWRTSGTNVTAFVVSSTVASALAVGLYIRIWRLN